MPEIRSPQLSLTTVDDRVTIEVSYAAALTPLERFLASRGLRFRDSVTIEGDDTAEDPTPFTPVVLPSPDPALIPVTAGDDELEVPRMFTVTCARGELQEDPGHDADELVARIDIGVEGMPGNVHLFTSAKRLLG